MNHKALLCGYLCLKYSRLLNLHISSNIEALLLNRDIICQTGKVLRRPSQHHAREHKRWRIADAYDWVKLGTSYVSKWK